MSKKLLPPPLRSELAELHQINTATAWAAVLWIAAKVFHLSTAAHVVGITCGALFCTALADYFWIQHRWPDHFEDET